MMAMALYPEKQHRAQVEIDGIIGTERLPTISDLPNLPYVNAVVKETMRWHPALPLGIARRTSKDTVYEGYFIPKGWSYQLIPIYLQLTQKKDTIVIPNIWYAYSSILPCLDIKPQIRAVAFEPNKKCDPEVFIPERFLGGVECPDPASWAFGFGRR
jgi:cytochrome P450